MDVYYILIFVQQHKFKLLIQLNIYSVSIRKKYPSFIHQHSLDEPSLNDLFLLYEHVSFRRSMYESMNTLRDSLVRNYTHSWRTYENWLPVTSPLCTTKMWFTIFSLMSDLQSSTMTKKRVEARHDWCS